jgi:hypothetical protein
MIGPEIGLTQPTRITEIGGFVNNCFPYIDCSPGIPLQVQIRPAPNQLPDLTNIIASFSLSTDNDKASFAYESVRPDIILPAGYYYILFVEPEPTSLGALMSSATSPFSYTSGTSILGYIHPEFNYAWNYTGSAAVRVLGRPVSFDMCIQDDAGVNSLQFNSVTGDYWVRSCSGLNISGTGAVKNKGKNIILTDVSNSQEVSVKVNMAANKATASIHILSTGASIQFTDRNIGAGSCACQ